MTLVNVPADYPDPPKFVAANVTPIAGFGFENRIRPSVTIPLGPRKVGVTGVLAPEAFAALRDDAKDQMLTVKPPAESLPPVLADLEKGTDFQVLLVQGPPAMAKALATQFPGFDVVVSTSEFVDPESQPESLNGGKTWLVTVGKKGQYVGMIGLPKDPKAPKLYKRIMLGPELDKFKGRGKEMKKLIDEDFVTDLRSAEIVSRYPKRKYSSGVSGVEATYVGAKTCAQCHPNTYQRWLTTKHAHAYEPLTDPKRNREADADCVRCHTTGFEFAGGFTDPKSVPDLRGNQCENCHGPGSAHAAAPDDVDIRKSIARSAERFQKGDGCTGCHDMDNSPHFDFPTMWGKVMHKAMDTYKDPRVHQGITKPAG